MLNTIEFGKKIAEIRCEAGITQEDLVERVGEEYISLSTLKRIESGQGHIDMLRIMRICKELGVELSVLLGERNTLRQALEKYYSEPGEEKEIQDGLYRQRLFYPEKTDSFIYEMMPIKTLMQFLIYLPLMDDLQLLTVLRSIEGDIFDREFYVLNKLWWLFREIPESNAKRYADYAAEKCTYDYFVDFHTSELTKADEIWLDPERSEEMLSWHDEYVAIIEKKKRKIEEDYVPQE